MILLSATRVDADGRFSYRVEPAGRQPIVTDDAATAAAFARLRHRGRHRLVAHARNWGLAEIVEPARH